MYFWSCVACIAATTIVGFRGAGWETASTAANQAQLAVIDARARVMAAICVERFEKSQNAADQLVSLKKDSDWQRMQFIQDAGWANLPGKADPVSGAVDICLKRILSVSLPAAKDAPSSGTSG
jgi:hypothetical protein